MQLLHYFELAAFLSACINFRKHQHGILKWFLPFLLLVNSIELGNYFRLFKINNSNNWIYNIFNPVEFCFYSCIFYQILINPKDRKMIRYAVVIVLLIVLLDMFILEGMVYLNSYSYIIICWTISIYCYLYFRQVLRHVDDSNLLSRPFFWISTGLFLFCIGEAILFSFFQYFLVTHNFSKFRQVFLFLSNFLNAILYTCLSISFFCRTPPHHSSLQESYQE